MEIRVLKYFLAIAQEKNITKAAEVLHISQPSLSKQIIDLENELGKKLFIRSKRGIDLTREGTILYKRAKEIIELLNKTEKEISLESEKINGEISIGGGIGTDFILKKIKYFSKKYPNVYYQLFSGGAEDVLEKLDNGSLDFGILIEPVDNSKYEYISFPTKNYWGILMTKEAPLTKKSKILSEDIKDIPLLIPKRIELQRELSKWLTKDILSLNIIATYNIIYSNPSIFIKNKLGYAVAISELIDLEENSNLCFRPFSPKIEVQFCIVWKKNRIFSKPVERFIEILKENF